MIFLRKKDVSDREAQESARGFLALMKPYLEKRKTQPKEPPRESSREQKPEPQSNKKDKKYKLTIEETEYLQSILDHPNLSVTARGTKLFGYSSNKMTNLKKILMDMGLLHAFTVDLGREFGGRVMLIRLTDKGYEALQKKPPEGQKGIHERESLEHLWWKEQIKKDYEKRGYRAEIEKELNGKQADIGVSKGDEIVAVEVELTPKNAVSNLKRNLEAGFTRTLIACKNYRVKKEVEQKAKAFAEENNIPESKYRILLLSEFPFIKQLYREIRG